MGAFSALTFSASGQLPAPLLYYPFDEPLGATQATDLSGNDYTGDVVGSVVFGLTGAPGGSSPVGAARFSVGSTGLINVPGLNVPTLLGKRDGLPAQADLSYTMACWILPNALSLTGDRFFFGQSVQGIHHGLRSNGRLHQAHWSADHFGVTQLNANDWVHVAFTYNGTTDTGAIYLNGSPDGSPTSKVGPNGSGNFVIGARQGSVNSNTGQAHYVGLIDEVVVYQEVLSQAQITQLAQGASPIPFDDADSDGMSDEWEMVNLGAGAENDNGEGNPNFGPAGDPDFDVSSNLEEFQRLTDPLNNDSDDDGIWDGYEDGTGVWTDAANTGTNPRDPDSDDDGLLDGVENPDLPFQDELQTGSDPNKADTDLDGFSDDTEVYAQTDPGNGASFPTPTTLPIVDDFEGPRLNGVTWLTNLELPQVGAEVVQEMGHVRINGRGHLYTRDQYDPAALGGLYIKGQWTFSGGDDFLQVLTRSDATPAGQYGETRTGIEFAINQGTNTLNILVRGTELTLGGVQRVGDVNLTPGSTYEFVVMDDGAGVLGLCVWELGNRANTAGISNSIVAGTATSHHVAIHNREGLLRSGNLEEIEIGVMADSDQDGMPDFWEEDNGLLVGTNDAALDLDNDGLANLAEFLTCADPTNDDTDGDGLLDGIENNNGTYTDGTRTGTDPLDADSDNDGLSDWLEVPGLPHLGINQPGTDPNIADSDGDSFEDRFEILKQSDPTDNGSLPKSGIPMLYYNFEQGEGAVVFDQTINYFDGTLNGRMSFVDGAPGGSTPGFGVEFTTTDNGFLNVPGLDINTMIRNVGGAGNGSYTMSCWLKPGEGTAGATGFIFGQTNQGTHHGIRNGGLLHSAHWSSDWNANTVLTQDAWVHATWTYDGTTDTANIYLNGVLDGGPFTQTATTGGGNLLIGTHNNDLTPATRFKGCLDEIAVWDEILPLETIQALAAGASPIGAPVGGGGLEITAFDFDQTTGAMSLTWNSRANASYTVNYDTNLQGFEGVLNSGVTSQGEATTLLFNRANLGADANAPRLFFRVREE